MPKRTTAFQQLVALIEDQLQPLGVKVTEAKEFRDSVTDNMREVDIAIEAKLAGHSFAIGIECIDRKRPAPVTWIEGIHDRNQTLEGLHKTVAVSRSRFTKPALVKAERYNIDTITLQEAEESNWVKRARQLLQLNQLGVEGIVGVRKGAKILVAPPSGPPYPPPPQLGNQDETMLYDPTGKPLATVAQVGDEVFSEPEVWEKIAQEVAPNTYVRSVLEAFYRNGTYLEDAAGNDYQVSHINFEGEFHKLVSAIPLERMSYQSTPILHGEGDVFGQPAQVVATEQEDGTTQFTVAIRKPAPPKPDEDQPNQRRS
jgi:hypothetical protein